MTSPSCPITRPQNKGPLHSSGIDIADVPTAHDLPSVITSINAINNIVQHITRGVPQINNLYPNDTRGIPAPVAPTAPQYGRYTWQEKNRSYEKQKVYNPDDQDQFVEMMTLAEVEWAENTTGHTLTYKSRK